jgi:uncharacterized protein
MAEIVVAGLFTYPIKACGGLSQSEMPLDAYGPVGDRRWMLVDAHDQFLTQREFPQLAVVQPCITADQTLEVTAPGMPAISFREREWYQKRVVQIWRDSCKAWDEGDEAAEWFSTYLRQPVRLMRMMDHHQRRVDERYAPYPADTSFNDGFPILIVSQESLDDLNTRIQERGKAPIPMTRFRPNIVFKGGGAYAEDAWKILRISKVVLDVVKPCARCPVTTVDQLTGTIPDHTEPLATLSTYRKVEGKVLFTQNAMHRAPGQIMLGDAITVQA